MTKPRQPIKAYDNRKFLHGDSARVLRIQTEYMEPDLRLQQLGIKHTVIFFGSARIKPGGARDWYGEAANLAEKIARWTNATHAPAERYHICTGGGPGIMEAVHVGAARVDVSLNIGLNISLPFEQHLNPAVDVERAFEFHYFFMRKFWFVNLSAAAIIFPGGFGTLDELFELLTLTQTGKSAAMPILLYGRKFWNRIINFKALVEEGLISPEDLNSFVIVDSVEQAYAVISKGLGSSHSERARAARPAERESKRDEQPHMTGIKPKKPAGSRKR